MASRLLQLDDVRQIETPDKIAYLFKKLGYNASAQQLAVDDLELPSRSAEAIWNAYLIADQGKGALQVLLFQLQAEEFSSPSIASSRMRAIAQSLCRRSSNFLLLGTNDYNQLMLVNPRKSFDAQMNVRTSIRKLLIDRTNPTNYDRDRLEAIAARGLDPQELYKVQCEAFDVEKLTKQFYIGYEKLFGSVQKVIKQHNPHPYFDDPSCLHQFAQRLLGRVMFLYFLQKKGFLGSDRNFLTTQYRKLQHITEPDGTEFYSQVLEPLFFETLNKQRLNDDSPWGRIPYLNGGLFDCDYGPGIKDTAGRNTPNCIQLPNSLFDRGSTNGILAFFNSYNFTVAENVQGDEDVAVDPEMLGKVFENLLAKEERGQSGTFYTPRGIVHFMCVEALSRYLAGQSGMSLDAIKQLIELDPDLPDANFNQLLSKEQARKLKQALDTVKICDLAVGSGAFPLGMMQVILVVRQVIARREGMTVQRGSLAVSQWKRDIIANNLYGVDIKPEAIEIAKLRMWLSLVVDVPNMEDLEPLPNLDYKLMCGDSLISTINGEQLIPDPTKTQQTMLAVTPIQQAIQPLLELQQQYYSAQSEERKALRQRIIEAEANVFRVATADRRQYWQGEQRKLEQDIRRMRGRASRTQTQKQQMIAKKLAELDKFAAEVESGERSLTFFQFHLHFNDVFREKGGFDITIGNPPYVRSGANNEYTAMRKAIEDSNQYETLGGKWDLYIPFIERSYQLLKADGFTTMIVSDAFCHSNYAQKSQNWFLQHSRVLQLDFISKLQIFDAGVRNVIYLFQKADGFHNQPIRRVHNPDFGFITLLPTNEQSKLNHRVFFPEDTAIQPISVQTITLAEICYISRGMVVHANQDIAQGAFKLEDLVSELKDRLHPKPFVEGKHVERWLTTRNKWLEWGTYRAPSLFSRPTFNELYEVNEKLLILRITADNIRTCFDDKKLFCNHTLLVCVPWHSLSGVRNKSIKKFARYHDEKPPRADLPKRENLENQSRRFAVKFLLAVMNSTPAHNFLRSIRRSNTDLYPEDWKQLSRLVPKNPTV